MNDEYDFSEGERGKFYRPDAKMGLPVYLDDDNRTFVESIAQRKGSDVTTVVNELLRSDQRIAEALR